MAQTDAEKQLALATFPMARTKNPENPKNPTVQKNTLSFSRFFTKEDEDPLETIEWVTRDAVLVGADGKEKFRQDNVEVPAFWQDNTINIVAEKYFRVVRGEKERSAKQMFRRVARWITEQGKEQGYFSSFEQSEIFHDELLYLLVHGMYAFNSPVWFNAGVLEKPQCSACFIQSVDDTMESIMNLAKKEVMLFKGGSGTGGNLSPLRSSHEPLSGGGWASGPVTFMKGFDTFAGVTKSGGTTRRAAKMQVLDVDHPDILEQRNGEAGFISCKAVAEQLAQDLYDTGKYSAEWNKPGNVYDLVNYQNANNSVRVPDEFMEAAELGENWTTKFKVGSPHKLYDAEGLLKEIAKAAHFCGDPGIHFSTTINKWHTCPQSGQINASNPCCFVGETLVETSEGRVRIDELARRHQEGEELPLAFAWDTETNLPVLRRIKKAWKAGNTTHLVEVVTDKGASLLCTPEHRFLLRNGKWVEAQYLEPGTRLRKIGRWANKQRSNRWSLNHKATASAPKGTSIQARWMWEQVNGPIPPGMDVHHRNDDPTDDRLSNLELVDRVEHRKEHAQGSSNSNFVEVRPEVLVEVYEEIEKLPKRTHKDRPPVTPTRWNAYIRRNGLKGKVPMAQSPTTGGRIHGMAWCQFIEFIEEHRDDVNDHVVQVIPGTVWGWNPQTAGASAEGLDVFDIEVEGTHNFSVASDEIDHGIIVHNSEYLFLDETACNLGSLNLMKFAEPGQKFKTEDFLQAVDIATTAKDIIVGGAGYPTPEIEENSHKFRTLGLGYTNLGALLTYWGLPYDSDEGRHAAACITSIMTGRAYLQSARIAETMGPFPEFHKNEKDMLRVIEMHRDHAEKLSDQNTGWGALALAQWTHALMYGRSSGFRNAQTTVLAPTGTISFLMCADTTGIEPMLGCITYKKAVGEGFLVMPNRVVAPALENLGYSENEVSSILGHISETGGIHTSTILKDKHKSVFAEALGPFALRPEAHILMMAAVQPFLSGGISKTVNLPATATVQDVEDIYRMAWKEQLKCIAIYRDGCKLTQPIGVEKSEEKLKRHALHWGDRRPMPVTRRSKTHKFTIAGVDGYITAGEYEDGTLGECWLTVSKQGSFLSGMVDAFAVSVSIGLQYGVPLRVYVNKFTNVRFEPAGYTSNPDIHIAKSLVDYWFRWLGANYGGSATKTISKVGKSTGEVIPVINMAVAFDGPLCTNCGSLTKRSGSCHVCPGCGETSGCS